VRWCRSLFCLGAGYRSILYVTAHAVLHTSDEILAVSNLDLANRVIYLTGSGSIDEGGDSIENPEHSTSHHSDELTSPNTKQPQGFSGKGKDADFGNMSQSTKFEQRMQMEDQENEAEVTENKAVRQCAVLGKEVSQLRQQIAHMQTEHEEALRRAGSGKAELEALNASLKNDMAKITTKVRSRDKHCFTVHLRNVWLHYPSRLR
jgi:chromosome segregation ATPase